MLQEWLLTAVVIVHRFLATTVGVASTFLRDWCGQCTSWQTAGGPGRYTNTGHGTGGSGFCWPPRAWEEWVALSLLAPGLTPGSSCSRSSTALRVGTPPPLVLCGGFLLVGAWVLVWAAAQLPRVPWLLRPRWWRRWHGAQLGWGEVHRERCEQRTLAAAELKDWCEGAVFTTAHEHAFLVRRRWELEHWEQGLLVFMVSHGLTSKVRSRISYWQERYEMERTRCEQKQKGESWKEMNSKTDKFGWKKDFNFNEKKALVSTMDSDICYAQ